MTHPYLGTVALIDGTTPLVVFEDGSSNAQMRRYTGSGDVNDPGNWTPALDIGHEDWPQLAGGPNGVFLLAEDQDNNLSECVATKGPPALPHRSPGRGARPLRAT